MKITSISISTALAFIVFVLFLVSFSLSANAQKLYSCQPPYEHNPFLHTISPSTGATLTSTEIILPGETVNGCNGMAKDPTTGVCWMILNITEPETTNPRALVTINPDTGIATLIGNTGDAFSSIAFDASGTLYGVTGDGASVPETLYTLSKIDGSPTFVTTLGNGNDGETLAFNPDNGLMYHGSGNCLPQQIFESINLDTLQINPIPLSGDPDICEQSGMVYRSGNVFLTGTIDQEFYSITTGGVVTFLGDMDQTTKGLAFDCGFQAPQVPTLSEWGLIVVVIMLGFVSLIVLRRRSAFQK